MTNKYYTVSKVYSFTLIELLISLAAFSFILVTLFLGITTSYESKLRAGKLSKTYSTAWTVLNTMKKEMESIYYSRGTAGFILEEGGYFGNVYDRIIFTTLFKGHEEVEYFIEPDTEKATGILKKRLDKKIDGNLRTGGLSLPIIENVTKFDVRVFDGNLWYERWDEQNGTPEVIEIKLEVKEGGEKLKEIPFYLIVNKKIEEKPILFSQPVFGK